MAMTSGTGPYDLLDRLAEEFAERYRRGERPPLQEYLDRYPELADEIRELFPAMVEIEQAEGERREPVGPVEPAPAEPPPRQVGDYCILREVGRGGMGVVYEAEQVSLGRRVALKILPQHATKDGRTLERFRREVRSAARLHHTNIVPVFEVGQEGETYYYAMQFIQGQGLDLVIDELRQLRDSSTPAGRPARSASAAPAAESPLPAMDSPSGRVVSPVAYSLMTGRFESPPEGTSPSGIPSSPAAAATLCRDVVMTEAEVSGSNLDRAATGSVAASAPSIAGLGGQATTSAMLPGGVQLSTVEPGRRHHFHRSVARIGQQAAQALAYAHSRGIVHRDIKPSNLLLDTAGVVWITDFGLAKAEDDGLTHPGDIVGTLRYMAPERFRGEGDGRADIYALGLTLYEMLTLRPAFGASDRLQLIELVKTREPVRPRALDGRISRDLETIVLKAIDKDPHRRYQKAEELAEDLRRFVDDEPIQARRISAGERFARWCRRNPAVAGLTAAVALLLIAISTGASLAAVRLGRAVVAETEARKGLESAVAAETEARKGLESENYAQNLALTERAWYTNNLFRMDPLLEQCPEPRRGWEWRVLRRLRYLKPLAFAEHREFVMAVAFSPDGRLVASSGIDAVYVWDAWTRKVICRFADHTGLVLKLAFSPDGKQLATASDDKTVILWDLTTGEPALDAPLRHSGRVQGVAFKPDGKTLATACIDLTQPDPVGELTLWDARTGEKGLTMRGHSRMIEHLALSPDGTQMATCSWDGTAILWDLETGGPRHVLQVQLRGPVHQVAFSPDSRQLVTSSGNGQLRIWDVATGKGLREMVGKHAGPAMCVLWSPDAPGRRIVSGGWDSAVTVWDAETGQRVLALHVHQGDIFALAFSPDGQRLASAGADRVVRIWDGRPLGEIPGPKPVDFSQNQGHVVGSIAFSPDGRRFITGGFDKTVKVWERATGRLLATLKGHTSEVFEVAFSPDNRHIASMGGYDCTVRVWDLDNPDRSKDLKFREPEQPFISSLAFSPDGKRLAYAATAVVHLFDLPEGKKFRTLDEHVLAVWRIAFSPDNKWLATASEDRTVKLWDLNGENVFTLSGHALGVQGVAFSPDSKLLASAGADGLVKLWNVCTRKKLRTFQGHSNRVWSVAFSPDGKRLVSGGDDFSIRIWDVAGEKEPEVWWWHKSNVFSVACCRDPQTDRQYVGAASDDGTWSLWELPSVSVERNGR